MPAKDKRRVPQPTRRRKVSRTSTSTDMALPSTGATAAAAAANAEVVEVDEDASGKMMCSNCGAIFTRDYLGTIWDVHDLSTWTYGIVNPECDHCGLSSLSYQLAEVSTPQLTPRWLTIVAMI